MGFIGIAIFHVGDLVISRPNVFIDCFLGKRNMLSTSKYLRGGSIYLGSGLTKAIGEFARYGNIFNGASLRTCLKLGSDGYEGQIRDILDLSEAQKGGPLTAEEQFAL